jgi:WD40 repeat protein
MKPSRESLRGVAFIIALVAAAVWYADQPELQRAALLTFNGAGIAPAEQPVCVSSVDWSADGNELLALSRGEISARGALALHAATGNTCLLQIDLNDEHINCAALAPDGRHVLAGTALGGLWWIDLESVDRDLLFEMPPSVSFTAVAIANEGRLVAAATNKGSIVICNPTDRSTLLFAPDRQTSITDVRFSHNDRQLVSARNDGSIAVWDGTSGEVLQELARHEGAATTAAFLHRDERIISAGLDDTIRIWDIASGEELWRGEFGLSGVTTVDVSQDDTTAAWGGFNGKIVVWDLERRRKKFEITDPARFVFHLKLSPNGKSLAVAGKERKIRLYDVRSGAELEGIDALGRMISDGP